MYMSEYQNMKRLDTYATAFLLRSLINTRSYPNRLHEWCQSRLRNPLAYDLLRLLFVYNPDHRLTASEALRHRWFSEDPKPTRK